MKRSKKGLVSNYFKPSIYVRSFKDVNINSLKRQGIKLLISDLDNTLVPHYTRFPNKEVLNFIASVRTFGIKMAIASNNTNKRTGVFAKKAGIELWTGVTNKPGTKNILKLIEEAGVKPSETIIMGDQIIMDILVANRVKAESILVQPLVSTDYKMSKLNIFLEKFIYTKLEKKNILKRGEYSIGNLNSSFELL